MEQPTIRHWCLWLEAPPSILSKRVIYPLWSSGNGGKTNLSTVCRSCGAAGLHCLQMVALDKCPGVRPIGIGEVLWHIIGKAILTITGANVQQATGALQVCAGQQAGCEAAIHAMRQIFEHPLMEAVLMVDASNAFNSLNRQVALRNILHICPSIAPAIINSYCSDSYLFIEGEVMHSSEGSTQGDPLATAMYTIATLPLIHQLKEASSANQLGVSYSNSNSGGKYWKDWPWLWILCQRLQVLAHSEERTPDRCHRHLCQHRCKDHKGRQETPWGCTGDGDLHWRICYRQNTGMGQRNHL